VVALALIVLLLGSYARQSSVRVSLVILLAGLVLSFLGWEFLKELRFASSSSSSPFPSHHYFQSDSPSSPDPRLQTCQQSPVSVQHPGSAPEATSFSSLHMELEVRGLQRHRSLVTLFTLAVFYGISLKKPSSGGLPCPGQIPIAIAAMPSASSEPVVCPVLGSGQGAGVFSPSSPVGSCFSLLLRCLVVCPSHHAFLPGAQEVSMMSPRFWTWPCCWSALRRAWRTRQY